jgi:hypothetical protein
MISTVTTTITTIVALTSGLSLSALASILLISFLSAKGIIATDAKQSFKILGKYLTVGILPLTAVFALTLALKLTTVFA